MGAGARARGVTPDEWELTAFFPGLRDADFRITSPTDPVYNCVAWAAGLTTEWWQPNYPDGVWPNGVALEGTASAVMHALATVGYELCENGHLEEGVEKAAIFSEGERFKHVARQLPSGLWTSKLGRQWDIEHELEALASSANAGGAVQYGEIAAYMARRRRAD